MTRFDVEAECPACGALFTVPRIRRGSAENCPVCRCAVQVGGGEAYEDSTAAEPVEEEVRTVAAGETGPQAEAVRAPAPAAPVGVATGQCVVCLRDDVRFDISVVSGIIDEMDGLITLDTRMQLSRGRGILARHIPQQVAGNMVDRLRGVQIPAFALDEGLVPQVERELHVVRIHDLKDDALYAQTDVNGTIQAIAWPLVAGGFCTKQQAPPREGPDLGRGLLSARVVPLGGVGVAYGLIDADDVTGGRRARAKKTALPEATCTLLLRGKSGHLYSMRFSEKRIRYAYLGSRRRPGAFAFGLFLTDVMRCCPQGLFPGSTRAMAAGQKMRIAKLKRESDYASYLEWACACIGERATSG